MGKYVFLTYNQWDGDLHKSTNINHQELSASEIQLAIDLYANDKEDLRKEKKRLNDLLSEVMNENTALRKFRADYLEKYNSGY